MKLVFCGTPMFAVPSLERLHASGFEIQLVVTQPDRPQGRGMALTAPPVKQSALKLGLPVIQPEKIKKNEEFQAQLKALQPDAIIVVGYGRIIPPWMLELAAIRQHQRACIFAAEVSRSRAGAVGHCAGRNSFRRHYHAAE